jgi:hypothetical protein
MARLPVLAHLGHGAMSDLSPLSASKRTCVNARLGTSAVILVIVTAGLWMDKIG